MTSDNPIMVNISQGSADKFPRITFIFFTDKSRYKDILTSDETNQPSKTEVFDYFDPIKDIFKNLKESLINTSIPTSPNSQNPLPYINADPSPKGGPFNNNVYDDIFFHMSEAEAKDYLDQCKIWEDYQSRPTFEEKEYYDRLNISQTYADDYKNITKFNPDLLDITINGPEFPDNLQFDNDLYEKMKLIDTFLADEYKRLIQSLTEMSDELIKLITDIKGTDYINNLLSLINDLLLYFNRPLFDINEYNRLLLEEGYDAAQNYLNSCKFNPILDQSSNDLWTNIFYIFSAPDCVLSFSQFIFDLIISIKIFLINNPQYTSVDEIADNDNIFNLFLNQSLSIKILNLSTLLLKQIIKLLGSLGDFNLLSLNLLRILYINDVNIEDLINNFNKVYDKYQDQLEIILRNESTKTILDKNNKIMYDSGQNYYKYLSMTNYFFYSIFGKEMTDNMILNIIFRYSVFRKVLNSTDTVISNLINTPENQKWMFDKLFVNNDSFSPLFSNKEISINNTMINLYKTIFKKYKDDLYKSDDIIEQKFFGHLKTLSDNKPLWNLIDNYNMRDKLYFSQSAFLQQFMLVILYLYELLIRFVRYIGLNENTIFIPEQEYFNNLDIMMNKYYFSHPNHILFSFFYNTLRDNSINEILENKESHKIFISDKQYVEFIENILLDLEIDSNLYNEYIKRLKVLKSNSSIKEMNNTIFLDINLLNNINNLITAKEPKNTLFTLIGALDDISKCFLNEYHNNLESDYGYLFSEDGNPFLINSLTPWQLQEVINVNTTDKRRTAGS